MKMSYQWKTYTTADGKRRTWYDRRLRLWTMQELDANGNQTLKECEYTADKQSAFHFLGSNQNETI